MPIMEAAKMDKTKINPLRHTLNLAYGVDNRFKNTVKKEAERRKVGINKILDYLAEYVEEEAEKGEDDLAKILDYFIEHAEELSNLLEKKSIKKSKIPSEQRIAKNPKKLAEIAQNIFRNIGLSESDFGGYTTKRGKKEAKWIKEDLIVLVEDRNLFLLDSRRKKEEGQGYLIPPTPKITVSQLKNLDTLIFLLERQNRKKTKQGEDGTADLEFYFKEYAKIRGYTNKDIERGGNFYNELRRDLISGGITSYILEKEKSFLIGNFYNIEVPKIRSKEKWRIYFNEPYKSYILNVKQYYPILLKAIQDKNTNDRKGYLYFFLKAVLRYSNNRHTKFKTQMKISTLLKRIKIGERVENRPTEAFKVLAECIGYVADNYKDVLSEIRLLNSKYEPKIIRDLSIFKNIDYDQFKENYLNDLGIKDIREALISFNAIASKKEIREAKDYNEGFYLPV